MKQIFCTITFIFVLCFAVSIRLQADNVWAMAKIENGNKSLSLTQYQGVLEKGANSMDYLRIYDQTNRIGKSTYNPNDSPVKLKYGYRMSDKQIFVYDYESNEERLAFDFTLSAGDRFSTYNGIEWEIDAAIDTLVNISYQGKGESTTKRLLKVHSVDGRYSDQWLEDFGSFTNHFMIFPMSDTGQNHALWMEYDKGCYLVREISSDPLFTHDYMPTDIIEDSDEVEEIINVNYDDGTLMVEKIGYHSPFRTYSCFYRLGDDFYRANIWTLNPWNTIATSVWCKDTAYYIGLPAPQSGTYTWHFYEDIPTGSADLPTAIGNFTSQPIFDLQGRKQVSKPTGGIYIQEGRKRVVK